MSIHLRRYLAATGLLLMAACQAERLTNTPPSNAPAGLDGIALRLQVDLQSDSVWVLSAVTPPGRVGPQALLGINEVTATTSNLTRSAPGQFQPNKVRVQFDVALTSRLTSATLIPATFPSGPVATGLVLFPYRVTQVVGGGATQVLASVDWNGDGSAGSGAPRNFFNDFSCGTTGPTSDCIRWEQFPAPLGPGETTLPRRVGFDVPTAVTSFQVLLVLAADIQNDLPAVARLVVTPPSYVMNDGFPANFSAVAYDIANNPLPWATIRWTSPDATALEFQYGGALVGTIAGPSVVVHGRKVGQISFTVRSGGVSVLVPVDIQVNTIVLVQPYVLPDSDLVVGEQVQAVASVKDNSGNIVPGFNPTWSTSDPNVATVDPATGLITAVGVGTVNITATAAAASGTIPITVSPPPAPGQISGFVSGVGPFAVPVPNVPVVVLSPGNPTVGAFTDARGGFTINQVPAGNVTVLVATPPLSCIHAGVPVTVPPGGSVFLKLQLTCTTGLEVRFLDGGVFPLVGERVTVAGVILQTGANGEITLTNQPPVPVDFIADYFPAGCYPPGAFTETPTPFALNQVVITVNCPGPGTVTGTITAVGLTQYNGAPVPVPGLTVSVARYPQFGIYPTAQSGPDGSYLIDPSPIGTIAIGARGGPTSCANAILIQVIGRATTVADISVGSCAVHRVNVVVNDISARPVLRSLDIRIASNLTGSTFGGTVTNNGQSHSFDILADAAAFDVSLGSLPANCQANPVSGVASPSGSSNVTLTLDCQ